MIRVQQLKLPVGHTREQLLQKLIKSLRIKESELLSWQIQKQSIDARRKSEISYVYTLDAEVAEEARVLKRAGNANITAANDQIYQFPSPGKRPMNHRPIIVGSGPAGIFCGYLLAEHGYAPVILERGRCVGKRREEVARFWKDNVLDLQSNVQFGEGGAGTFSDGKLNTLVKDVKGRNKKVLDIFIGNGAPEEIGYTAKPHIGTDILMQVVERMRKKIEGWGGVYLFETCVKDMEFEDGEVRAVVCEDQHTGEPLRLETDTVILAVGHSARDTFAMLNQRGFVMEAKAFAVGLRVEHPQSMISENQYGENMAEKLPAAPYKLTAKLPEGRGVYSFCMCPGGYVVNASSEENRLAVNGMSYSARDGKNANSAIIVTVTPGDFPEDGPLGGVAYQRRLEEKAFALGHGKIPQQLLGDFEKKQMSQAYGAFLTETKGQHVFAPLHELLEPELYESFLTGMHLFARKIPGFDRPDAILSGVESRTSSPVRICRDDTFESNWKGVYPCGEGAGYAGGIMSAAMDGLKIAEAVAAKYHPFPVCETMNENERK